MRAKLLEMNEVLDVLVIDDDAVDRMAVRRHLNRTDLALNITEAENASSAFEYLKRNSYSCIFLDYRLPDADGISLVSQLRGRGFLYPIIVLTGQGDEQVAVELMKAGASDYLAKSRLSADSLARMVRNAVKEYKSERRLQVAQSQLRRTNILLKQQNRELEDQRRQIEQQNLKLLEANRLKSEFLATVTHEIRTPLNAIMGFSQILSSQSKGPLNDYQAEMVNRIFTNGENLLSLVNDILDMSRIEANRLDLAPSFFDIEQLIHLTVAELQPLADKKDLDIQVSINLKDTQVYNDKQRLKQVLINLVSNAIKFTDAGYVQIEVNTEASNSLVFWVRDTGIGINSEQLDSIFHPFLQGDQTMNRQYPGTGLGLAITHSLISMMEGFITVKSELGKGTAFKVSIPREIFRPMP